MTPEGSGVGQPVLRREDDRYLRGKGEFIADIRLAGMRDVAFVRSPLAHAAIRAVHKPPCGASAVFGIDDLQGVKPIVANSSLAGFKPSAQPVLAQGKVRHVGEAVAMCLADTRAAAEDLAAAVSVDYDELPAVTDMLAACQPGSALVHEAWGDNVFLQTRIEQDFSAIRASAAIVVHRSLRTARQCMSPMEGRGLVAVWDRRLEQLLVHTSTQMPHIIRTGLAGLEAAQVASILPGPYRFGAYRCTTWSVATNKPGILPYRGVARAGVCYAMESVLDGVAHAARIEPHEVRLRNLIPAEAMPFDNITNKHFDSGDYPQCLRRAVAAIDVAAIRRRQAQETGPVRTGLGVVIFCEQAAHGTSVYHGWGIPMVPGFEQAVARLTPDGGLELRVGIQSHGQGLETTLAQVAHEVLGIPIERIRVVHGDTALTPYSTGTWGSRCMVMAGGAVATACRDLSVRIAEIGAYLLQRDPADVVVAANMVSAGQTSVGIGEVARTWYLRPQDLPPNVAGSGLEVASGYRSQRDTGTFSYAAHAVVVSVDTEMGDVAILDYAVCEDGGVLVNPMIVDGQVIGGVAQGIGTALYEEMPFDAEGQPLATTLADYMLPGATEVPVLRIEHMQTPSPYTRFGQKGIGEGGAIGPPAAIANAVNDALRPFGAAVHALPITPRRVLEALDAA